MIAHIIWATVPLSEMLALSVIDIPTKLSEQWIDELLTKLCFVVFF